MPKRIILLTNFYYPETAAVAAYAREIAVHLNERGIETAIVTSRATYQRGGRLPVNDVIDGLPVRRVIGTRFDKRRLLGRISNLGTFLLGALAETVFGYRDHDALVICNAPLFGAIGWFGKKLRGRPYVCIVEDIYPELAVTLGVFGARSPIRRVWDFVNARAYSNAAAIITLGDRMRAVIESAMDRAGAKCPPIHVINSWADGEAIRPLPKAENAFAREQGTDRRLTVLYSGNMGLAHDLETIIEAADRLRDDDRFQFLFIGDGGKKPILENLVAAKKLANVRFLPYQPVETLPFSLTCGDLAVVTMERGVEGLIIPSKIYGSLAAGQAILGLVTEPTEVADIIAAHDCGFQVPPGDVAGVVDNLLKLAEDPARIEAMKANARRCFDEHYGRRIALDKYFSAISSISSR